MGSDFPLVSIIIPAYNHERYMVKCLDSVLETSYSNKEIIIIDDGSTDSTDEKIADWIKLNSNKIDIIYKSQENQGVSKTLNKLVSLAKGEYICLLASDDYLLPDGLSSRVNYLEDNYSKMAVIGDCIIVNNNNKCLYTSALKEHFNRDIKLYMDDNSLKNEIIRHWSIPGPVLMVRKKLYEDNDFKYNENLMTEDWDFYLKLVSKNYLGFINKKVSAYRVHEENISNILRNKVLRDRFRTVFANLSFFGPKDKIKLLSTLFIFVIIYCARFIKLNKLKKYFK
ncbi:glycosyltransferase [Sulfurimonas sp.]|uniref:glycosyltransferase n=1 Tax=Sulfurimonas sp. TaxID=2022749 RepID=UPI002617012F|nr:glycosyltransferase [Sulfurimonas sp.]MDD5157864.1 glycosyltransferase [Sulfurimonas sp.]